MQRSQLEHLIRAAAEITNEYEFVIIGSQSILGSVESPPAECTLSMEADIYPLRAPELADLIDGVIGELSFFHDHFGYYGQGVSPTTAQLPKEWQSRLVRLQSQAKDAIFNRALLKHGIVTLDQAIACAAQLDDSAQAQRATA